MTDPATEPYVVSDVWMGGGLEITYPRTEPQVNTPLLLSPRGVDRRNVAIIGAPGAGATTLVERMVSDAE